MAQIEISKCEDCEWVRSEQSMPLNEICFNKQSPYYLKVVNTDDVTGCNEFEVKETEED